MCTVFNQNVLTGSAEEPNPGRRARFPHVAHKTLKSTRGLPVYHEKSRMWFVIQTIDRTKMKKHVQGVGVADVSALVGSTTLYLLYIPESLPK